MFLCVKTDYAQLFLIRVPLQVINNSPKEITAKLVF